MADITSINLDTNRFEQYMGELERELLRRGGGRLQPTLEAAGYVFMGFIRERFVANSRGGGDWKPLAPSTLKRRRKGSKTQGRRNAQLTRDIFAARGQTIGTAAILIDTSTLLSSITPVPQGGQSATEDISAGVRVGTRIDYAQYHQVGGPNLPAREIIVEPDPTTERRMGIVIEEGLQKLVDRTGGKPGR